MIVHKKTLAVSTAALLMTGGVAYAFINATSVSGSGTAGTATASTELLLTPADNNANPFSGAPNAGVVSVVAENKGTVALRAPANATVTVSLDQAHSGCPANSFTATFAGTGVSVPAKTANIVAGAATVVFNEKDEDQSSCIGAVLTLSFSTPT